MLFLVVLFAMGFSAFKSKQHLIVQELLLLPAVALALAFAAYQHVKNSEGTRTGQLFGINLVTFAAGGALLFGAGFFAYLTAVEFSIRQDAENEFLAWSSHFKNLNAADETQKDFAPIVHKTIEPGSQQNVSATDLATLKSGYNEAFVQIVQSDVARICLRNPGQVEFKPTGLVKWERDKTKIACEMNAELFSPEGVHVLNFKMLAEITSRGQRIWLIENKGNYVIDKKLTEYGKRVEELEYAGMIFGQRVLNIIDLPNKVPDGPRDVFRYTTFVDYLENANDPTSLMPAQTKQYAMALTGGSAATMLLNPTYVSKITTDYFTPTMPLATLAPDDRAKKEKDARETFGQIWSGSRIVRAQAKLTQSKDIAPVLTFDDKQITVTVPVELLISQTDTARGRMVCRCTDPATVAELNRLKSTSKAADATALNPKYDIPNTPWRVVQFRSDLKPVATKQAVGADMSGPGGGMAE
jgi:hypothetical protein